MNIDVTGLEPKEIEMLKKIVERLKNKSSISEQDLEWFKVASSSFEEDWENEEDSEYDNWREIYNV
ncbi:MAG: hypothetical protein DWQ06_06580 [Calditrichaeota bacterium]|nr:MAG: hypothetical protein DWQ06_06580 [Calditrichota bacterium]